MRVTERHIEDGAIVELSLRTAPEGGKARNTVHANRQLSLMGETHLVLLIHGFNVNEQAARNAYKQFQRNVPEDRRLQMAWVFWPGDKYSNAVGSALSYSWMPKRAQYCALKMAGHIAKEIVARAKGTVNFYIVAHSLGCRLTLELLRILSVSNDDVRIRLVALMAAAVPTYMVKPGEHLDLLEFGGDRVRVLFSRKDLILKYIFRPGQRFESSSPVNWVFGRAALGSKGLPQTFPRTNRISEEETKLGHGGYWSNYPVARTLASDLPISERVIAQRPDNRERSINGIEILGRAPYLGRSVAA